MNKIIMEEGIFFYCSTDQRTALLDCNDFISNNSRIAMHGYPEDLTISKLIIELFEQNSSLSAGTGEETLAVGNTLLDVLMAANLCKTALPIKVLEIGAVSGVVSYHLAYMLGKFHPESKLCCVCDTIGNDSGNQWLDRISLIKEPPGLSFLVADYEDTQLQDNSFDITVLNGTVDFMKPLEVIQEARRLTKDRGIVICYSTGGQLLESSFKSCFTQRTEYPLSENCNIMYSCNFLNHTDSVKELEQRKIILEYIDKVQKEILNRCSFNIEESLNQIEVYMKVAIENRDISIKIQLIELKEMLLEYTMSTW